VEQDGRQRRVFVGLAQLGRRLLIPLGFVQLERVLVGLLGLRLFAGRNRLVRECPRWPHDPGSDQNRENQARHLTPPPAPHAWDSERLGACEANSEASLVGGSYSHVSKSSQEAVCVVLER